MKRLLLFIAFFALLHRASALPTYDPFADATSVTGGTSYTVGSPLAGQTNALLNGWGSLGSNFFQPEPFISAENLTYPGLPASLGGSVSFFPATNMSARLDLRTNGTSGTFYFSFILKITNISAVLTTPTNNAFAGFSDTAGGQVQQLARLGSRIISKQSGSGYVLGMSKTANVNDFVYDTTVRNLDEVLLVVGSYELVGGVTNCNLWINPDTNTFGLLTPPPPTLSAVSDSGVNSRLNGNGVRAFVILCQNPHAPAGIIDELRVEKTWGYVTGGTPTIPVAIYAQPSPRTVVVGDRAVFAVGVTGTTPSYQWRSNDVPIAGANSNSYAINNAQATDAASYSVVITNSLNSLTSAPVALAVSSTAPRLYHTNVVVIRVGDGAQVPSVNGNSLYLDQFTPSGTYLNTMSIPETGPSAMIAIGPNVTGGSLTGNCLTRSDDQRLLVIGGYNTNLTYGDNLKNSDSTVVPRGMAVIDTHAQYTLTVSNTDYSAYSQSYWRGGITDNGTNFWGAANGSGGTYYFGYDAAPAVVQSQFGNVRSIATFNGDIYCVSAVSGNNGVLKLDGMPTTAATPNILFPGSTSTSDLEVSPDGNLIYVADDRSPPNGGIQRWEFDGSIWTNVYTLGGGLPQGARHVTADFSGPNPVLYAISSDEGNNRLVTITDTGAASAGTTLASSGVNQNFRGIRFGPTEFAVVRRPTLLFSVEADKIILTWSGSFTLLSATNVAGVYTDVPSATSPYTNSLSSASQLFFGLRK